MLKKITVNKSFYLVLILVILFKVYHIFLLFFIFVFLHELSHIAMAKKFGLNIKKMVITPIGQVAIIENIEKLVLHKKLLIVSIGVILNLSLALFFSIFENEKMQMLKNINLVIAFFNCLPILPLDGGRFFSYILGSRIGDLKAGIIIKKIGIFLSFFMFILGIIQVFIYHYNITLLALSLYFIKINKQEYLYQFYKIIINKQKYEKDRVLRIREILVDKSYKNKNIILMISLDYFLTIKVYVDGNKYFNINEKIFLDYIQKYGINGTIYDVLKEKY